MNRARIQTGMVNTIASTGTTMEMTFFLMTKAPRTSMKTVFRITSMMMQMVTESATLTKEWAIWIAMDNPMHWTPTTTMGRAACQIHFTNPANVRASHSPRPRLLFH